MKKTGRLTDRAYEHVFHLVTAELDPGVKLSENSIAEDLDMSKTPVREALQRLEADGLVTPIPYVGYVVPHVSFPDTREAFEVREAVEGYAAGLAAIRMKNETLRKLQEAFDLNTMPDRTVESMKELNDLLHGSILEAADNVVLGQALERVRARITRAIRVVVSGDVERFEQSFDEHRQILQKLEQRDRAGAEDAMRQHIRSVAEHVLQRLR